MIGKAEWLLRHYKAFRLRKYVLSVRLEQLTTTYGQAKVKDQWIESEAFRSSSMSEYVQHQHNSSPTEMIALNSDEGVRRELILEAQGITKEIHDYEFCINLCDGILKALSAEECWIVTERYIENKTLDTMVANQPEKMNIYSRQTMGKRCKQIMHNLDGLLAAIRFPKAVYDESSNSTPNSFKS